MDSKLGKHNPHSATKHIGLPPLPIYIYMHNGYWIFSCGHPHILRAEYYNGDLKVRLFAIDERITARGKEAANIILRLREFQGYETKERMTRLLAAWESTSTTQSQ
jgi:hypothetical protein